MKTRVNDSDEEKSGWEEGEPGAARWRLKQEAGEKTEAALLQRHSDRTPQWESRRPNCVCVMETFGLSLCLQSTFVPS